MHRLDDFLDVAFHIARHFRRDQAGLHETVHHRVAFGGGGSLELLDRAGQQVQLFAQLDVLELQVAGGRRQVVRGDGSQRVLAVRGRIGVRVAGVGGVVHAGEPFHHAAQQAVLAEYRAYVIRHGAQILADHQTVHAGRFNGQDRDHRLIVVRNVRATARAFALRNPPQTE